jgi:hypothetical protein
MVRPVYLASRTPVLVLPAAAIGLGVVIAELSPLLVACAVTSLVAASAIRFTARSAVEPDPYPTRASLAAVAPRMRCGDSILAAGLSYSALVYYRSAAGVPSCVTVRPFPTDVAEHAGWLDLTPAGRSALARDAELSASAVGNAGSLWTFVSRQGIGAETGTALMDALTRVRPVRESFALTGSFFDEIVVFRPLGTQPAHP